mgnify:CR=1 FL=1
MTRLLALIALTVGVLAAGCSSEDSAASNLPEPVATKPAATAADMQKELANSNLSEERKRILGGGAAGQK